MRRHPTRPPTTAFERLTRAITTLLVAGVLFGSVGCAARRTGGSDAVDLPDGPVGIVGDITQIDRATEGERWGTILVEGGQQPTGAVSDKALVTVAEKTHVLRSGREIPPDELATGMAVRVWFEGPVAESYPVQGTASFIEVQ